MSHSWHVYKPRRHWKLFPTLTDFTLVVFPVLGCVSGKQLLTDLNLSCSTILVFVRSQQFDIFWQTFYKRCWRQLLTGISLFDHLPRVWLSACLSDSLSLNLMRWLCWSPQRLCFWFLVDIQSSSINIQRNIYISSLFLFV